MPTVELRTQVSLDTQMPVTKDGFETAVKKRVVIEFAIYMRMHGLAAKLVQRVTHSSV